VRERNRLGSWLADGQAVFAVAAPSATEVQLSLFDDANTERRIPMQRFGDIWRCVVPDLNVGQEYGFRADGPWDPDHGLIFNPNMLLIDPYARIVTDAIDVRELTGVHQEHGNLQPKGRDSATFAPRSVLVNEPDAVTMSHLPVEHPVIYEAHVRGLTMQHPGIPEDLRGTYAGAHHPVILDYLTGLGVTAIEFLPIHSGLDEPFLAEHGLVNYWGYNPLNWFAPNLRYSASARAGNPLGVIDELRSMVADFHAAGISVILDVVYNHTCEGPITGPMVSLRGLDNRAYYRVNSEHGTEYLDTTGCGNSVRADGPLGLRLITDSLRWWVTAIGIDGFRFDLAVTLARDPYDYSASSTFLDALAADPILRECILIAEPWDVGREDSIQTGSFPVGWHDWNNRYRDVIRDFWRGVPGGHAAVATAVTGSRDLFGWRHQGPNASVNFITAHDGFTLRDLVSYEHKHNQSNAQGGTDGTNDNRSWNCGIEGVTDDPTVIALRRRQVRALIGTLLISWGIPMITMGDERGRTQAGNNNAYCQDNPTSWMDWFDADEDLLTWVAACIAARRNLPRLSPSSYAQIDVQWFRPDGRAMEEKDWADTHARSLAYRLTDGTHESQVLVLLNAWSAPVAYAPPEGERWSQWQVALSSTDEEIPGDEALQLPPHSLTLLTRR
jgi:glycogen operon protein